MLCNCAEGLHFSAFHLNGNSYARFERLVDFIVRLGLDTVL